MKQCIAICTHRENLKMFNNLLKSIKLLKYPIVIVVNDANNTGEDFIEHNYKLLEDRGYELLLNKGDGFEIGALKTVLNNTDYDEILLLQDSCEIKDYGLFDLVFETKGSVALTIGYMSYLGKYERIILNRIKIPIVKTKTESIRQEGQFNRLYLANCEKFTALFGNFGFTSYKGNRFENKFNRKNLISENEYIIKRKGIWAAKMLEYYNGVNL